jgi:predicted transcriptional regulator
LEEGLIQEQEGVAVFDSTFIEPSIVYTEAMGAISLFDKQDGYSSRGRGGIYESLGEVFIEPFSQGF